MTNTIKNCYLIRNIEMYKRLELDHYNLNTIINTNTELVKLAHDKQVEYCYH
jgi:hypothetical protein